MQVRGHGIGVCGWSLKPASTADLIGRVKSLGLNHLQLGLNYLLDKSDGISDDLTALKNSGLLLTSSSITFPGEDYTTIALIRRTGGLVPNDSWPQRKEIALQAGKLTAQLGITSMEFHAGFIPTSSDPFYTTIVDRVREVAVGLSQDNIDLLLETGQESASELLQFLNDLNCRNVGCNFDPANMILYGSGDPIEAVSILGRHIKHVHAKDAVASNQPRMQFGKEVPLGHGQVGVPQFLDALDDVGYTGPLCIEREAGSDRMADIRLAIEVLKDAETVV